MNFLQLCWFVVFINIVCCMDEVHDTKRNWFESHLKCEGLGSELASIHTKRDDAKVYLYCRYTLGGHCWFGLKSMSCQNNKTHWIQVYLNLCINLYSTYYS